MVNTICSGINQIFLFDITQRYTIETFGWFSNENILLFISKLNKENSNLLSIDKID